MSRIRRRHSDRGRDLPGIARYLFVYLLLIAPFVPPTGIEAATFKCSRTPDGHGANKTPADGRFHVRISENTVKYTPGMTYTSECMCIYVNNYDQRRSNTTPFSPTHLPTSVTLEGIDAGGFPVASRHKFSGFMLVVESKSGDATLQDGHPTAFGVFSLLSGTTLTKITCANMVTHTTTAPKSEIKVLWTAPETGSGCVAFRATVIEHRDVWFMDDGPLTKVFCEDEQTLDETLSGTVDPCCACAEAKYELTFEGLWSRNTHPKDFPSNNWLTRFSDIIGATHTVNYR